MVDLSHRSSYSIYHEKVVFHLLDLVIGCDVVFESDSDESEIGVSRIGQDGILNESMNRLFPISSIDTHLCQFDVRRTRGSIHLKSIFDFKSFSIEWIWCSCAGNRRTVTTRVGR